MEKIRNPEDHIGAVLERAKTEYIQKTYNIPSWSSAEDFLEKLAFRTGKLLKVWLFFDCAQEHNMLKYSLKSKFIYSQHISHGQQAQSSDTLMHSSRRSRTHTRAEICLNGYVAFYSWMLIKHAFN